MAIFPIWGTKQSADGHNLEKLAPANIGHEGVNLSQLKQNRPSSINIVDNTAAPPTEVLDDVYILDFTLGGVNAAWDGALAGDIVQFDGALWQATTPVGGDSSQLTATGEIATYIDNPSPQWVTGENGSFSSLQTVWIATDGDDTLQGNNLVNSVQTIATAVIRAIALAPTGGNNISIESRDFGAKDMPGNTTIPEFVSINMGTESLLNASKVTLAGNQKICAGAFVPGVSQFMNFVISDVTKNFQIEAKTLAGRSNQFIESLGSTNAPNVVINIERIDLSDMVNVLIDWNYPSNLHLNVKELIIVNNDFLAHDVIQCRGGGKIFIHADYIEADTGSSNITFLSATNGSEIHLDFDCGTFKQLYDVDATSAVYINYNKFTESGTSTAAVGSTVVLNEAGLNIYQADGTLTGDRIIQGGTDTLTIREGVGSALSPSSLADNFVLDGANLNVGMSILTAAGGNSQIFLGEFGNSDNAGRLQYVGSVNETRIGTPGNLLRISDASLRIDERTEVRGQAETIQFKVFSNTTSQGNPLIQLVDTAGAASWNWYNSVLRAAGRDTAFQSVAGFDTIIKRSTGATGTRFDDSGDVTMFYDLEVVGEIKGTSIESYNVVTKTFADTPYAASDGEVVLVNATGGNVTVTLPATVNGMQINVKKTDASANTVTIDANGGDTIDGSLTKVITTQYESLTLVSDGSDWFII